MIQFKTIKYIKQTNELVILDQTKLPEKEVYIKLKTVQDVYQAIKTLRVRGAPLIGVAAAYGVVLAAGTGTSKEICKAADFIKSARPTAVNLSWAVERMKKKIISRCHCEILSQNVAAGFSLPKKFFSCPINVATTDYKELFDILLREAQQIEKEDKISCKMIGQFGAKLIENNFKIMVHCNAGALATSGIGTALGILYTAKAQGKKSTVYSCETRPLLQGARLTSWELTKNGIETYTICDNMAATYIMEMDLVLVGADRIARNGDTANKIGTKGLAIIANYYNIPFYVAAPVSSFDPNIKSGKEIPIECRDENEIRKFNKKTTVSQKAKILNPAFDVTPAKLITAIITEKGIIRQPYVKNIPRIIAKTKIKNGHQVIR